MKSAYWGILFLILGILGIVMIDFFGNLTVSNEQNYYLLKEITEASMIDSLDEAAYKEGVSKENTDESIMHCSYNKPGTVRIEKERFVESFVRRFAESAERNKKYELSFDDIIECPPKVTVTIKSTETKSWFKRVFSNDDDSKYETDAEVVNKLSAILEGKSK